MPRGFLNGPRRCISDLPTIWSAGVCSLRDHLLIIEITRKYFHLIEISWKYFHLISGMFSSQPTDYKMIVGRILTKKTEERQFFGGEKASLGQLLWILTCPPGQIFLGFPLFPVFHFFVFKLVLPDLFFHQKLPLPRHCWPLASKAANKQTIKYGIFATTSWITFSDRGSLKNVFNRYYLGIFSK